MAKVEIDQLDQYPFSGHGVIVVKRDKPRQDSKEVLLHFGKRAACARQKYREFVAGGIDPRHEGRSHRR